MSTKTPAKKIKPAPETAPKRDLTHIIESFEEIAEALDAGAGNRRTNGQLVAAGEAAGDAQLFRRMAKCFRELKETEAAKNG